MFIPFMFKKLNKRNVIVNFHGSDLVSSKILVRFINKISHALLSQKAKIIVPSEYFYNIAKNMFKKNSIYIIPSGGVDTNVFKPKRELKLHNRSKIIIGFASGVTKEKGFDVVIECLQKMKSSKLKFKLEFHIIRYGKDIDMFIKKIKMNNLENMVKYEEVFEKENMGDFYSSIDFLIFPTLKEALGLVALESLACGTPVIGTNDFAIPEFIEDCKNGFLFKKNDYIGLYKILSDIVYSNYNYGNMCMEAINMVNSKYSKSRCIKYYEEILKEFE